jgi:hypothetical protein
VPLQLVVYWIECNRSLQSIIWNCFRAYKKKPINNKAITPPTTIFLYHRFEAAINTDKKGTEVIYEPPVHQQILKRVQHWAAFRLRRKEEKTDFMELSSFYWWITILCETHYPYPGKLICCYLSEEISEKLYRNNWRKIKTCSKWKFKELAFQIKKNLAIDSQHYIFSWGPLSEKMSQLATHLASSNSNYILIICAAGFLTSWIRACNLSDFLKPPFSTAFKIYPLHARPSNSMSCSSLD